MTSTPTVSPVGSLTVSGSPEAVASVPRMAGYFSMAEATEHTGRKPWAVHQLAEAGQLTTVTFNGRPFVSAAEVDALASRTTCEPPPTTPRDWSGAVARPDAYGQTLPRCRRLPVRSGACRSQGRSQRPRNAMSASGWDGSSSSTSAAPVKVFVSPCRVTTRAVRAACTRSAAMGCHTSRDGCRPCC